MMHLVSKLPFYFSFIVTVIASSSSAYLDHVTEQTVKVDTPDGTRSYVVYTPKKKDVSHLLLTLHGFGESSSYFLGYTDFRKHAYTYGYEIILPESIGSGWNAGGCCFSTNDDIGYMKSIIRARRQVHGNLPVYGYGFSNGGMLIEALLCEGIVQKAVSTSGVLTIGEGGDEGLNTCDQKLEASGLIDNRALLSLQASVDGIVPWEGGSIFGNFPNKWTSFLRWGQRLGCRSEDEWVSTGLSTGFSRLPCPRGNQVVLFYIRGATHWAHLDWRDIYGVYAEDVSVKFLFEGVEPYQSVLFENLCSSPGYLC
ncbi:hypothetical protein FOL47_000770 [Perkinsus chesapeaki]|uniref:Phospholipase abhd3 n=1 Tax=Perkinsus chesapeaki TaxID=330153 RepID=A0A7J6KUA9_PERCH|nr:hypothetical protein FOL47_000770 [Perkinsus chesapeaki]